MRALRTERTGSSETATQLRITVEMANSNDASIELTEWQYTASLDGKTVYTGTRVAALTLPPGVPMTTSLPIVVAGMSDAKISSAAWQVSGTIGYRATRQIDRLLYQLGVNRLSSSFDVSGSSVTDAPMTQMAPLAPVAPPAPAPPAPPAP